MDMYKWMRQYKGVILLSLKEYERYEKTLRPIPAKQYKKIKDKGIPVFWYKGAKKELLKRISG